MRTALRVALWGILGCALAAAGQTAGLPDGTYQDETEYMSGSLRLSLTISRDTASLCTVRGSLGPPDGKWSFPVTGQFGMRTQQLRARFTMSVARGRPGQYSRVELPIDGEWDARNQELNTTVHLSGGSSMHYRLRRQDAPRPSGSTAASAGAGTQWVLRAGYPKVAAEPYSENAAGVKVFALAEAPNRWTVRKRAVSAAGPYDITFRFTVQGTPPAVLQRGDKFDLTMVGTYQPDPKCPNTHPASCPGYVTVDELHVFRLQVSDQDPAAGQGRAVLAGDVAGKASTTSRSTFHLTFQPDGQPKQVALTLGSGYAMAEWVWDLTTGSSTPTGTTPAAGGTASAPDASQLAPALSDDPAARVTVTFCQGTVNRRRNGQESPLAVGGVLTSQDAVVVWPGSAAVLRFPDGATLELREKTIISVKVLLDPSRRGHYDVAVSQGQATATRDPSLVLTDFVMSTPTASVTSTHTVYSVAYDPAARRTTVAAKQGTVVLLPTNPSVPPAWVEPGQIVQVDDQGAQTLAAPSAPSEFQQPSRDLSGPTGPPTQPTTGGTTSSTGTSGQDVHREAIVVCQRRNDRTGAPEGSADVFRNVPQVLVGYTFEQLPADTEIVVLVQADGTTVTRQTFIVGRGMYRVWVPVSGANGENLRPSPNYRVTVTVGGKVQATRGFGVQP